MTFFQICTILITLTALFSFINFKLLRLPTTIGITLVSVLGSLALVFVGRANSRIHAEAIRLVSSINFHEVVLHAMLAFLLFAGSIHLDLSDLRRQRGIISVLSIGGTLVATFLVAGLCWLGFRALHVAIPPIDCLLFGALISPTDPIAVLGIVKKVGASNALQTQLAGESLFNDGIGVVTFLTIAEIAVAGHMPSASGLAWLLAREVAGGVVIGLACGILVYQLIKRVENYQVEVLLTLALAMGVFSLADVLHMSAPIAVVVAGLFFGNHGRSFGMSDVSREHLDMFWELIDDILNAVLFLMIGLQLLAMPFEGAYFKAGIAAIVIVLLSRYLSVAGSVRALQPWSNFERGTIAILTWGGLRGGLSIAMALSLPHSPHRDLLVFITYMVVVFSILGQGLTLAPLIRRIS
jgi:CPA1 family monovalent cation:H+ antiporter